MAWEIRNDNKRVFYRSVRVGGKVQKQYWGSGPKAVLMAALDAEARARRRKLATAFRAEVDMVRNADIVTMEFAKFVVQVTRAAFRAAGFHQHARGYWRRKRGMDANEKMNEAPAVAASNPSANGSDKLRDLLTRAVKGDATTLSGVHEFLNANEKVWRVDGDLALKAEQSWIVLAAGNDLLARASMLRELRRVADSLADEHAPAAERLLARQAALAWFEGAFFAARCAQTLPTEISPAHREFLHRRADRAQAKFAAAVRQLATVQKLLRPAPSPLDLLNNPTTDTKAGPRNRFAMAGRSRVGVG
jgi:hypothetical protein